jgi:glyoxylase-like metal-dependent hydrolase (beta-lactamase superfamily II)
MIKEVFPSIFSWSRYSEEKKLDFNGYFLINNNESIIIDPPELNKDEEKELLSLININFSSPLKAILLTNIHHERASHLLKDLFSIPVWVNEFDKHNLEMPTDNTFIGGEKLFCGIESIQLKGQKSPGETAFYIRELKVMILGDALIGKFPGQVNMLPLEKYKDIKKAKKNLKLLMSYEFNTLLLGDGTSILKNAKEAVSDFLSP